MTGYLVKTPTPVMITPIAMTTQLNSSPANPKKCITAPVPHSSATAGGASAAKNARHIGAIDSPAMTNPTATMNNPWLGFMCTIHRGFG
jgi:hypothetical protein